MKHKPELSDLEVTVYQSLQAQMKIYHPKDKVWLKQVSECWKRNWEVWDYSWQFDPRKEQKRCIMYYLVDIHQYNTEIPHNNFASFRFITTKLCLGNIICNWRSAHLKDEYYPFTPPLDLASVTSNKINYFSHKLSFLVFPRENHCSSSRIFLYCCCFKTHSKFQIVLGVTWAITIPNEH